MKKSHQSGRGIVACYARNALLAFTLVMPMASPPALATTAPPADTQAWQEQVIQLIQQKSLYPFQARLINESGTAVVALVIGRNGDIHLSLIHI